MSCLIFAIGVGSSSSGKELVADVSSGIANLVVGAARNNCTATLHRPLLKTDERSLEIFFLNSYVWTFWTTTNVGHLQLSLQRTDEKIHLLNTFLKVTVSLTKRKIYYFLV